MKKLSFIVLAILSFTGCTNSNREHRDNASTDPTMPLLDTTNKAQTYTADVNLNGDEKVFLLNASLSAQRITEFAHLAGQLAKNNDIKNQAKRIEVDYRKMLTDLQSIANGKGIGLSRNNPSKELLILKKEKPANFDKLYVDLLLVEHANLVQQLSNGIKLPNKDIKKFSSNSLELVNRNNSDIAKMLK